MDPRSKALSDLINDVSTLEDTLAGFEQDLAKLDLSPGGSPDETAAQDQQLEVLQQTIGELQQELSQKRSRLQELSDGSTGCARRNVNPFDRQWLELTPEKEEE